jgi:integrase-like protein
MKNNQAVYQKWLCYYLDFCRKYNFPQTQRGSLIHFLAKLQEKKQTKAQQDQASNSISLYYELILTRDTLFSEKVSPDKTSHCFISSLDAVEDVSLKSKSFHYQTSNIAAPQPKKTYVKEKVFSKPLAGASWRAEYTGLANEIRVRLLKKRKVLLIFRRFFTRPESGFGLSLNP